MKRDLKSYLGSALTMIAAGIAAEILALPGISQEAVAAPQSELPVLSVTVFAAPSQVVWFPTLIQKTGLDAKHGFRLEVKQKPSQVAYSDFVSGTDPVCYCISTAAGGRFVQQGANVSLLWNIFNYDHFIVTANPTVQKLKDLEGKTLIADTVTGSWALAYWFLQEQGVDLSKVQVRSSGVHGAGSFAELIAGRADGLAATPIEASVALADSEGTLRALSVYDSAVWKKYTDNRALPSIAAGAWRDWAAKPENLDLLRRLYAANLDAAELVRRDPDKAADLIEQGTGISKASLTYYFAHFASLIDIRPISENRESIAVLTQKVLPEAKQLDRPLTPSELDTYVSDFKPQ